MKVFVPGRICLFGEHSDWAGGYRRINAEIEKGYALICGTNQGIYAEVNPHPTSLVLSTTKSDGTHQNSYEIPMNPKSLLEEAQKGGFWSYVAGVAYQVLTNYHVRGLVIDNFKTDLPIKKGLSSSAALECSIAMAVNHLFQKGMSLQELARATQKAENKYVGVPCGIMDQSVSLMAHSGSALLLDCRDLSTRHIAFDVAFSLLCYC